MAENEQLAHQEDNEFSSSADRSALIKSSESEVLGHAAITRDSLPTSRYSPYFAIALLILLIVFLIVVVLKDVPLKHPGKLSTHENVLYVTGTTILAGLISSFVSGQIRVLWTTKTSSRRCQ